MVKNSVVVAATVENWSGDLRRKSAVKNSVAVAAAVRILYSDLLKEVSE